MLDRLEFMLESLLGSVEEGLQLGEEARLRARGGEFQRVETAAHRSPRDGGPPVAPRRIRQVDARGEERERVPRALGAPQPRPAVAR